MAENDKPNVLQVESGRWLPRLKIAWTVFFAVLTVALCVLWVRSYWWEDGLSYYGATYDATTLGSSRGALSFIHTTIGAGSDPVATAFALRHQHGWSHFTVASKPSAMLWVSVTDREMKVFVPHLLAIFVVTFLAAAPWLRWRFSLRTMLITTTLVAVVLGLIVWSLRG